MLNRIRMALDKISKQPVEGPTQLSLDLSKAGRLEPKGNATITSGYLPEPVQLELNISPAQKLEGKTKQLSEATKVDREETQRFQDAIEYIKDNKKSLLGYGALGTGIGAVGAALSSGGDTMVVTDPRTGRETLLVTEEDDSPVPTVGLSGLSLAALASLGLIEGQELVDDVSEQLGKVPAFPSKNRHQGPSQVDILRTRMGR